MTFVAGDLVNYDGGDTVQIAVFQAEIDDPFYRTADRVPVGVEASGGFLPTQTPVPRCEEMAEDIATGVLALRPRDGLDLDAAGGAIDAALGVGERDRDVPGRDELELPGLLHAIVSGTRLAAAGASGIAIGPGDDLGDGAQRITRAAQTDRVVNEALDAMDSVE